jgi:ABC-type lipoprotein release transport system permease subunit
VVARVVRRGLVRAAPGLAIGVVVALATLPLLGVLLGGSNARDFGLIVTVVLAYAAITSVASIVPALEAAGVDPNVTLRNE